jgi:hypothetical protein
MTFDSPEAVLPGMIGANPTQLRELGTSMQRASEQLRTIFDELNGLVRQAHWDGGDAAEFRRLWSYPLGGRVIAAAEAAQQAAGALVANAVEQESASSDPGSAGSGGVQAPRGSGLTARAVIGDAWFGITKSVTVGGFLLAIPPFIRKLPRTDKPLLKDALKIADSDAVRTAEEKNALRVPKILDGKIHLPQVLKLAEDGKDATVLKAVKGIGIVGAVGSVIDVGTLGYDFAKHADGYTKANDGVSVALDVAAVAAGVTPIGAAVVIGSVTWGLLPNGAKVAVDHAVMNAAKATGHTVATGIGDASHIAGSIASGGVRSVTGLFHHL